MREKEVGREDRGESITLKYDAPMGAIRPLQGAGGTNVPHGDALVALGVWDIGYGGPMRWSVVASFHWLVYLLLTFF